MDVDVDSRPPREHEFSFSFPEATCHQNDPGYGNPGPWERISSLAAALSNGAAERMPRPPYSVASSGNFGVGSFPLIGHDCLLLVLSEFLLFVLGIQELIPG
jgi:hypothetical protein